MATIPALPNSDLVQTIILDRLAETNKHAGERLTVDWRDSTHHLNVISMPLDLLLYNPETHRIRAQKDLFPKQAAELVEDPWTPSSQNYLEQLLKSLPSSPNQVDPEFQQLRDSLENFGQKDPGLITADGILVNGNTRCAALRELGEQHIRVAVLPSSATWDDINAVELSLQLRKEHKRDYSYINRLIAVEELIAKGRRLEDVARHFHVQVKTLQNDRWIYGLIDEAIQRSTLDNGHKLTLSDFEDHQEKLRELQRAYSKLLDTNRDGAESLKEIRLALTILGFSKTDIRLAQPDFRSKYLDSKLDHEFKKSYELNFGSINNSIPGLPGLEIPAESEDLSKTRLLTTTLLKARSAASLDPIENAQAVEKAKLQLNKAAEATERALDPAGRDARLRKRKVAAPERLSDACDDIDLCTQEVVEARSKQALDVAAIDEMCSALKISMEKLARQLRISTDTPGQGIQWVLDATNGEFDV